MRGFCPQKSAYLTGMTEGQVKVGKGTFNVELQSESITRALRRKRKEVRVSTLNETHHNITYGELPISNGR